MDNYRLSNLLAALSSSIADSLANTAEFSAHSTTTMSALITIDAHPGDTIDKLSRVLKLSPSGMSRAISRLKKDGLVETQKGVDGRTVNLLATAQGKQKVQEFLTLRHTILQSILESLSQSEQSQLLGCLEKILFCLPNDVEHARNICRFCDESICHQEGCPVKRGVTNSQFESY
ncbi:MAG: MarR family winged helix-turn-helix transcriptional regulator [Cyanobacteria bacterium P01_G01_bin.19]